MRGLFGFAYSSVTPLVLARAWRHPDTLVRLAVVEIMDTLISIAIPVTLIVALLVCLVIFSEPIADFFDGKPNRDDDDRENRAE